MHQLPDKPFANLTLQERETLLHPWMEQQRFETTRFSFYTAEETEPTTGSQITAWMRRGGHEFAEYVRAIRHPYEVRWWWAERGDGGSGSYQGNRNNDWLTHHYEEILHWTGTQWSEDTWSWALEETHDKLNRMVVSYFVVTFDDVTKATYFKLRWNDEIMRGVTEFIPPNLPPPQKRKRTKK